MLEQSIVYSAKFSRIDSQRTWFRKIEEHAPISKIASLCHCSERTIRDWKNGKFRPRYDCIQKICHHYKIQIPTIQKISRFEHLKSAGKKGGLAVLKKYGKLAIHEQTRKERWVEWWNTVGKDSYIKSHAPLEIKKPKKGTALAEFIGIMMGDGAMSTYHIGITLNATDDAEYVIFVSKLIKKLFRVQPKIYKRKDKNAVAITVARKLLVNYLHSLGLPIGNKIKQNINIPAWITSNPQYARSCVRGLMDTDGSVFSHSYTSKNKTYTYKKLSFSSASALLRESVHHILAQNDIKACNSKTNIRIDSKASVDQYFKLIGSHNPKHLKRLHD